MKGQRDGVVVLAFPLQSVDLGFIPPVKLYQKTLKNGVHSFCAWHSALGEIMKNKPASSLVVSLGKALNRMPPSLCGRQVAQFSLRKEGWWHKGHPTVKQIPCYKLQISAVVTPNWE